MASKRIWSLIAFLPFVAFGFAFPVAFGGQPATMDGQTIPVNAMLLPEFKSGEGPIFGKLEYMGGVVLATQNGEMGAVSSIRLVGDDGSFVSVMDTGHWATGRLLRDADGRLSGVGDYKISEIRDPSGKSDDHKENVDAEGMALDGDRIFVSFERTHRINTYPYPEFETAEPIDTQFPVLAKGDKLKGNGGLEALMKAPADGPLEGSLVFVAERSYNREGNFIAGVQSGAKKGTFYVERLAPYDITDGVFLDDGSFLLLERKFGLIDGIGMRIRKFSSLDIQPGATVSGETLIEADFTHQIDNMEGLDAYRAADGSTHLIVVSDDNHSLLERNLILEFKLLP